MALVTKFAVKRLNLPLLMQQVEAVGLGGPGLLLAGFFSIPQQRYDPNAARKEIGNSGGVPDFADPGELRFTFPAPLTPAENTNLNATLNLHDATTDTDAQTNKKADNDAIPALVDNFNNWNTLSNAEKDNNHRQLTRLVARLLDSTQDL